MIKRNELTHLDLFSGIGGFSLAAESCGFKTILFCEIDEFCQKVLKKHWSEVPIIPNIRDIDGTKFRGATLLTGGFPCQPFSNAGKRKGKEDDRHLWPEMFRVIKESKPSWIVAENVTGIINMELRQVLSDLESIGYDFPRDNNRAPIVPIIPACGINSPHRRYRVWIIANSNGVRWTKDEFHKGTNIEKHEGWMFNDDGLFSGIKQSPEHVRGYDGLSTKLDESRVKALGNAIVPQVAKEIIECIYQIEKSL